MPCGPGESKNQLRTSRPCMPLAQAWKGLFRKEYERWDYVARATSGKSARICNTWRPRQPSMSFVSSVGWRVSLMRRPGSHPLSNCIVRLLKRGLKGFATSIKAV